MAERVIYSCDLCNTGGVLRKNQFAVERLLVRSLTNGGGEFNLDLCRRHLDSLRLNAEEGPRTPAKRVAAKRSAVVKEEKRTTHGGAKYVKSACDVCGREFPTVQGMALHKVRTGHGRPKGASRGGSFPRGNKYQSKEKEEVNG